MKLCVLNFALCLFTSIFLSSSKARISSSYDHESQSPILITNIDEHGVDNSAFQRFQSFLRRQKRQALSTSIPSLNASSTQLGNETLHNQALIHWSGNYSSVIFILTRRKDSGGGDVTHSVLWRSTDYGKTYHEETMKFDKNASLISYYTCPKNKKKVIFIDTYNGVEGNSRIWISTTEGETYTPYEVGHNLDKILFHPEKEDMLLGYDKQHSTLIASMDLGKTWHKIHERVTQDRYYWYKRGVDTGPSADRIVFFEYQEYTAFNRPFFFIMSCLAPFCDWTSFQGTCNRLGRVEEKSLLVQDDYVFVQKPGALEKLYVSYRREEFVKAQFHRSGEQTDIHVVSSHSNTVVVGVNHDNGVTNLYFSDEKGRDFSLSLDNVLYFNKKVGYAEVYTVDIHEVKGVKGVYLANHRQHFFNRTMITWNNGKTWQKLNLPTGSVDKACMDCSLNLHCAMSQTKSGYYMPTMLSKDSAPGLIIAHGSVGKTLFDAPPLVTVYVSNDTGVTWRGQVNARNLFVMGDQGAIILAVNMYFVKSVQTLSVSSDFGYSWQVYKFSDEKVNVDGILTEPGEDTHIFTLFGHGSHRGPWKVYAIDMSVVINRNCSYPKDFDMVNVPFSNHSTCHLGMRRSVEVLLNTGCLIGRGTKRRNVVHFCNCTTQDYECGFDYVLNSKGGCIKLNPQIDWIDDIIDYDYDLTDPAVSCINGERNVTTKYRKIPGDRCVNELPGKLYTTESCNATTLPPFPSRPPSSPTTPSLSPTSTTTTSGGFLRLVNASSAAKMGERLQVKSQNCDRNISNWRVMYLNDTEQTITKFNTTATSLTLSPPQPGVYQVMGSCGLYTDYTAVTFLYPIQSVYLLHPPVAELNENFQATAFVTAPKDLPGIPQLLGAVTYTWTYNNKVLQGPTMSISAAPSVLSFGLLNREALVMRLSVMASNTVSRLATNSYVAVSKTVVSRSFPLFPSQGIDASLLSSTWLHELRAILTQHLLNVEEILELLNSNNLFANHNFHVYIKPEFPLKGIVYFSSTSQDLHDQFNKVSSQFLDIIKNENIVLLLPHEQRMYVGHMPTSKSSGMSPAVIVTIVFISLLFIVALVFVARKYGRSRRWKSYFTMRGNHPSLRLSHIVRPRDHDLSPIVDEEDHDEFYDEQLERTDYADPPQDGTLEFKQDDHE